MKILVVFWSMEGNTKYIAEKIAKKMNADIEEIKLIEDKISSKVGLSKFFWGGKQAVMKEMPEINNINTNLNNYDLIIIGTPVWASTLTPAVRSFLVKNKISGKRVALFCSYDGGAKKAFDDMRKILAGNEIVSEEGFVSLKKQTKETIEIQANEWVKKLESIK